MASWAVAPTVLVTMANVMQPYRGAYLRPSFHNAAVVDVMTPGIITCAPETPLDVVAELMATHNAHAVAVGGIGGGRVVWGIVDSLDLVRVLCDTDVGGFAEAISRRPEHAIAPDAPLSEAARLMDERNVTHLIVVDGDRPVGVISTLDIAGAAAWGRR